MEKRTWSSQQKLQIVQVSQTQYYKWRDQLLKHGHQTFDVKNVTEKEQHLEQEVQKLKQGLPVNKKRI